MAFLMTYMLCYVMWNLFTVGSLQFCNDSTIASLEANQNRVSLSEEILVRPSFPRF